jgi:hypothetical protein
MDLVTYSTYQVAPESLSTDTAKAYVSASEPGIFHRDDVELTSALAEALNITTVAGGGPVRGTNAALTASCTILNVVGYNLAPASVPEPVTAGTFGLALLSSASLRIAAANRSRPLLHGKK